jgi:D-tagatose-1,6-bisphosphate aldolase subunit GatZ/KbaZ
MAAMTASRSGHPHLLDVVRAQKRGEPRGLYSVCSANPFVLEASMLQARNDGEIVCIESTSNQVNPEGGYTGQTPAAFVRALRDIAGAMDFPMERVLLGGDHLGPFPHQKEPAQVAMAKAREMVRQYVLAGFAKIHLDASMRCADDPEGPLSPRTATERTADLCAVAEAAHAEHSAESIPPLYIVGTEVPTPGGEQEQHGRLQITRPADAQETLDLTRAAFAARSLEAAWERVVGLVVQPGVEFGETEVFEYDRPAAAGLRSFVESQDGIVFEAHSTDYQTEASLRALVLDHFAILKVGPGLTFAFREAVFALANVEREWLGHRKDVVLSNIETVLEEAMLERPAAWSDHYRGNALGLRFARRFSLSDRIRYYWALPPVAAALRLLLDNLQRDGGPPGALLSQFLPAQNAARREGRIAADPRALVRDKIMEVTAVYSRACGGDPWSERPAARRTRATSSRERAKSQC